MRKTLFALALCSFLFASSVQAISVSNVGATGITTSSAFFCGYLTATNGTTNALSLRLGYGISDGSTNFNWWGTTSVVLSASGTGSFSTNISGLVADKLYYYRWYAAEGTNHAWASVSTSFWTKASVPTGSTPAHVYESVQVDTNGTLKSPTNFLSKSGIANLAAANVFTGPTNTFQGAVALSGDAFTVTCATNVSPDVSGVYLNNGGIYGGAKVYEREDGAWYIWYYTSPQRWLIADSYGATVYWSGPIGGSITGTYVPSGGGATGNPVVTNAPAAFLGQATSHLYKATVDLLSSDVARLGSGFVRYDRPYSNVVSISTVEQVRVTGSLTPDVTGFYTNGNQVGQSNTYYQTVAGTNYYILYSLGWAIGDLPSMNLRWFSGGDHPLVWTNYAPSAGGVTGIASVTNASALLITNYSAVLYSTEWHRIASIAPAPLSPASPGAAGQIAITNILGTNFVFTFDVQSNLWNRVEGTFSWSL